MAIKRVLLAIIILVFSSTSLLWAGAVPELGEFSIKPFSANDFYVFVKIFSEMRGPLRSEILKDKKTNFENADPLKYLNKIKDKKDVREMLQKNNMAWGQFVQLFGNILLGYFSLQPNETKAALVRQLADYGLLMSSETIPPEYRETVNEIIKSKSGSELAAMVLDQLIEIPAGNISIVRENKKSLDQMFYTKHWVGDLK